MKLMLCQAELYYFISISLQSSSLQTFITRKIFKMQGKKICNGLVAPGCRKNGKALWMRNFTEITDK